MKSKCFYIHLFKTKHLEIEFILWKGKETSSIFSIHSEWTIKGDHAGFRFYIELWKGYFNFNIYDNRHWDWKNDRWKVYEDKKK